jgi:hypothetical protein
MTPINMSPFLNEKTPLGFRILRGFPGPLEERAWREFLPQSDWPSHYTSPEFFLEPYWDGKHPFAVLAVEGNKVIGVLTGLHEENQVISGLPARPQTCFDRTTNVSRVAQSLAQGLLEESGSAKLVTVYSFTRLDTLRSIGFQLRPLEGVVVLDLTQGPEALFRQIHTSARKNIRIATRKGVEVCEASTEDDFSAYYDVYCRWLRSSRKKIVEAKIPSSVAMESYRIRSNRRLFLARHDGQIIAASSVRFSPGGVLEYSGNPSLEEHFLLKPNDLLKWKVIEWGCSQEFPLFSLGGAHQFHLKSGGAIIPVYRHRFDRTWFRRHDMREAVTDAARKTLRTAPLIDRTVRRLLRKRYE